MSVTVSRVLLKTSASEQIAVIRGERNLFRNMLLSFLKLKLRIILKILTSGNKLKLVNMGS